MIIVLTQGRSGSSLLMQSLRHLGIRVAGRAFDTKDSAISQKRHEILNPHGYWEEPGIYYGGLSSVEFHSLCKISKCPVACKMDIKHFTDENQTQNWLDIADKITSILISYRDPSEQAFSEYNATLQQSSNTNNQERFQFVTKFLRDYQKHYGGISYTLEKLRLLKTKVYYVNYAGVKCPEKYITDLTSMAEIHCTPEQYQLAVSNVSARLYRVTQSSLTNEEKSWAIKLGALDVYLRLKDLHHT